MTEFSRCARPGCLRKTPPGATWCCSKCALAAEGYGVNGHGAACEERAALHGEFTEDGQS